MSLEFEESNNNFVSILGIGLGSGNLVISVNKLKVKRVI
jgi:hypothetical protein